MNSQSHAPAAASTTGGADREADERAVRALFDATSRAWADGDADAFVAWYTETATAILPGTHLSGRAGIRAGMGGAFAGPLRGSKRDHRVLSIRFLGAEVAVVVTNSATTFPGEAAAPAERRELATWVLRRPDDRWLVEAYHGCPAPVDAGGTGSTE